MKNEFSDRLIFRFSQYYAILRDFTKKNIKYITSNYIAKLLNIDETQVRKDFASICAKGKCRVGYNVVELKKIIGDLLGNNTTKYAFIIGAGNLGTALAQYKKFNEFGLEFKALFDIDKTKIGKTVDSTPIYDLNDLKSKMLEYRVDIAVLTTPNKVAQQVCDFLVSSGIKYIWNFTPSVLSVPKNVNVWQEDLIGSFLQFCATYNVR